MYLVKNHTDYVADAVLLPSKEGGLAVVSVIKATFTFSPELSEVNPSPTQLPLFYGDQYYGEPGKTGVRYPSDTVYGKKGADIAVNGHAYAPGFVPAKETTATVNVGSVAASVLVSGDRTFTAHLGFVSKSAPKPFVKMPLVYERAFGGTDTRDPDPKNHGVFMENPIGTGFRARQTKTSAKDQPLPNIEDIKNPVKSWTDRPKPAGFGCIPPFWEPRRSFAGTYNDAWRANRMPLPPEDGDIRCNNAANPNLITAKPLTGKENVTLIHLHPARDKVDFTLPDLRFTAAYTFDDETVKPAPVLDTLIIEPDESRFILVYRASYSGPIPISQLRQVVIYENT